MKKKLTALFLVVAVVAALLAGATLSYFTDNETVTNTFTVGDVTIDVYETDANGNEVEGNFYENVVPGVEYKKDPTIKNTGSNDAYVRMLVTIPADLYNAINGYGSLEEIFVGFDYTVWSIDDYDYSEAGNYFVFAFNYNRELEAGEAVTLFNKFVLPAELTQEDLSAIDNFYISVEGQAIQAEGFDSADDAFAALDAALGHAPSTVVIATSKEDVVDALNDPAAANVDIVIPATSAEEPFTTNFSIPGGKEVTISGATEDPADTVIEGQIATLASNEGTLVIKNCTINVDNSIVDSTGISQTAASAIAIWGDQTVICENVVFNMTKADSTAITAWWDTGVGTTIIARNCTFNCNGQRPIRATGNVTVENCIFNDPYRYAVQLTAKTSTATLLDKAVINFNNNTINNGPNGKAYVYGVQLEGADYGCYDLIINGSGNTINAGSWDTENKSTMYYCECGLVQHDTITWNTEVAPVHEVG